MVKENIGLYGFSYDKEDESVTRTDGMYRQIFERCGLNILKTAIQANFPKVLFFILFFC